MDIICGFLGVAKFDLQSTDLVMPRRSYKRVLPHEKIWHGFTFKRFGGNYGPSIFHPFLTGVTYLLFFCDSVCFGQSLEKNDMLYSS